MKHLVKTAVAELSGKWGEQVLDILMVQMGNCDYGGGGERTTPALLEPDVMKNKSLEEVERHRSLV